MGPQTPFCSDHAVAPAVQRGGWLSAWKRRQRAAGGQGTAIDAVPVFKRIWVGAAPSPDQSLPEFTTLVLAGDPGQPATMAFQGRVLRCALEDAALSSVEAKAVMATAREALSDYRAGGRLLIAGADANRPALVAGVVLLELTRASPAQVIERIRRARSRQCLSNHHFQAFLTGMPRNFGRSKL